MTSITIRLLHSKETHGTHVFKAENNEALVTTLYVRKSAFLDEVPKAIVLTVADN